MKKKVNPSEFRHLFRFDGFTKTANTSAGNEEQFSEFYTTRGKWEKMSGSSGFDAGADKLISVYRATCYWRSALETLLTKDTRLFYNNRIYRIENVEMVNEERMFYEFTVSEWH